jgi:hypothetical protein
MRIGSVGLEQIVVRGKVLKKYRLGMHIAGDGELISRITQENPAAYASDIYALFNYFEPGRWSKV